MEMAELLNNRSIGNTNNNINLEEPSWQRVTLVSTRNYVLSQAATMMMVANGLSRKKRVYVWDCVDRYSGTKAKLNADLVAHVNTLHFRQTDSFQ